MPRYVRLSRGDPAPWFDQRSLTNPRYVFDTAAGRYIVLCFFGSAGTAAGRARLDAAFSRPGIFDDAFASFFGVSADPADEAESRIKERYPGYRFFCDFDAKIARLYGAASVDEPGGHGAAPFKPLWVILDPFLRVVDAVHWDHDGKDIDAVFATLAALPPVDNYGAQNIPPPILVLPNVFEAEFCQRLIDLYEADGGEESGFMRDVGDKTLGLYDSSHKVRRDATISPGPLIAEIQAKIHRRVKPQIKKAFQFEATRMERYIVACYGATEGGHFRPHRDNTSKGTAHRRFAISINLNADFDGGLLGFPEFGAHEFKPAPGSALVFSCSLLHTVSPVTRGRRFAFLPFLYDETAAAVREQNAGHLHGDAAQYKSGAPRDGE